MSGWVQSVVAACRAVTETPSSVISSIDVVGTFGTDDRDKQRLFNQMERLAEEDDLEVTLDIQGDSFAARFARTDKWPRGPMLDGRAGGDEARTYAKLGNSLLQRSDAIRFGPTPGVETAKPPA